MENIQDSTTKEFQRTSKSSIGVFIFAIFKILGLLFIGVTYDVWYVVFISVAVYAFFIWWAWYSRKRAIRKNIGGALLSKFAFYVFIATLCIEVLATPLLINGDNSLQDFAVNQTPSFFADDLKGLRDRASGELSDIVSYSKNTVEIKKIVSEAGVIERCERDEYFGESVTWGPRIENESIAIGYTGVYQVRCYGENVGFNFYAEVVKKNDEWLVEYFDIDTSSNSYFKVLDDDIEKKDTE